MRSASLRNLAAAFVALIAVSVCGLQAQTKRSGERERLVGAWHLVSMKTGDSAAPSSPEPLPQGMLIYTRDGHMSVQLMYPKDSAAPNNEYVQDRYEASFGSYDVNEAKHTLTHHVQGSVTRDLLIGKALPRSFQLTDDDHLVIRSADHNEHWAVTWEHY